MDFVLQPFYHLSELFKVKYYLLYLTCSKQREKTRKRKLCRGEGSVSIALHINISVMRAKTEFEQTE